VLLVTTDSRERLVHYALAALDLPFSEDNGCACPARHPRLIAEPSCQECRQAGWVGLQLKTESERGVFPPRRQAVHARVRGRHLLIGLLPDPIH